MNKKTFSVMKILSEVKNEAIRGLGDFFSKPMVASLCQSDPLLAGVAEYFGGLYSQEQYETLTNFVHLLHSRLLSVEKSKIDMEFFDSYAGKRIIGKIFRGILRDNRIEKIQAMANLTVNLYVKSKLNLNEREIYVDILDGLNSLQLSILQNAVLKIRARTKNSHKGFGWEKMNKQYQGKGISGALLLQSIRVLESNGLVNKNGASIVEQDKTHFLTAFGEQFYTFISDDEMVKDFF